MALYSYFLSENEALDISVAVYDIGEDLTALPCPQALRTLFSAMVHISPAVWSLMSHPEFHTDRAPAAVKAYSILANAAAKVAREYWIESQAASDAKRAIRPALNIVLEVR